MPDEQQEIRARAFWSGTITFGLVSIPVNLFPGVRSQRAALRMLADDGTPLQRRFFCEKQKREVDGDEIVRGYEISKGKFVIVTDDELEALEPKKSRDIDLRRFVPADDIDPLFFERSYYLAPAGDTTKAYRLLAETMEQAGRAGIATFVMRGKEYLVAIVAEDGLLRADTLRFADELRTPKAVGLPAVPKIKPADITKLRKLIKSHSSAKLAESELEDGYSERIRKLMFIGYTYRWIRPLDEAVADQSSDWFKGLTPLQQQLLGYGPDHASFWGIKQSGWIDDEIPLRAELKERGLLDREVPFLR